jgi:hypothetical protein
MKKDTYIDRSFEVPEDSRNGSGYEELSKYRVFTDDSGQKQLVDCHKLYPTKV